MKRKKPRWWKFPTLVTFLEYYSSRRYKSITPVYQQIQTNKFANFMYTVQIDIYSSSSTPACPFCSSLSNVHVKVPWICVLFFFSEHKNTNSPPRERRNLVWSVVSTLCRISGLQTPNNFHFDRLLLSQRRPRSIGGSRPTCRKRPCNDSATNKIYRQAVGILDPKP